jgi:hypothetical protein
MNEHKKQAVRQALILFTHWQSGGAALEVAALEQFYDSAYQEGRESLLRAAEELFRGRSTLDNGSELDATRAKQSVDSLKLLGDWMEIDPDHNRYDSGLTGMRHTDNKYRVTVWRAPRFKSDINCRHFYGSTQLGALADAAQSVVAEVEEARKKK